MFVQSQTSAPQLRDMNIDRTMMLGCVGEELRGFFHDAQLNVLVSLRLKFVYGDN